MSKEVGCALAVLKKWWSRCESNPRPLECDSNQGHDRNQEDPSIPNDFSRLVFWLLGLFGSLGQQFTDRRRTMLLLSFDDFIRLIQNRWQNRQADLLRCF